MFSATKRKARRFALTRHRNTMLHFFAGKLDFPCCAWTAQVTDKRWPESELFPELPAGNEAAQIREAVNYDPNGFGDSMAEGALYPFGFGLSCTIFEYSGLEISPKNIPANGEMTVRCLIKNIGGRAGDEVAQLYIHQPTSSVTTYVLNLCGFERITLKPGEIKTVCFKLPAADLQIINRGGRRVVEPGEFAVHVGTPSENLLLDGTFNVSGASQ